MTNLVIIRGLPGAGKSTYAKKYYSDYLHLEADQYFMVDGEYRYDKTKVHLAHKECRRKMIEAINAGINVVVSNTFVTKKEIDQYINGLDCSIAIINLYSNYGSIHNVPQEVIDNMRLKWNT